MKCVKYTVGDQDFACELELFNYIFSDRWKLYIVWHLLDGAKRFKDLTALFPAISEKTLSVKLKELESLHIVRREAFAEVPPRVEYSLTAEGLALKEALTKLHAWGGIYAKAHGS